MLFFANVLKMKYRNISFRDVFIPLCQYMLESPLAAITAVSLFGSLRALHTWVVQYLHIIIFLILQVLSSWVLINAWLTFSSLAIDFQADFKLKL